MSTVSKDETGENALNEVINNKPDFQQLERKHADEIKTLRQEVQHKTEEIRQLNDEVNELKSDFQEVRELLQEQREENQKLHITCIAALQYIISEV